MRIEKNNRSLIFTPAETGFNEKNLAECIQTLKDNTDPIDKIVFNFSGLSLPDSNIFKLTAQHLGKFARSSNIRIIFICSHNIKIEVEKLGLQDLFQCIDAYKNKAPEPSKDIDSVQKNSSAPKLLLGAAMEIFPNLIASIMAVPFQPEKPFTINDPATFIKQFGAHEIGSLCVVSLDNIEMKIAIFFTKHFFLKTASAYFNKQVNEISPETADLPAEILNNLIGQIKAAIELKSTAISSTMKAGIPNANNGDKLTEEIIKHMPPVIMPITEIMTDEKIYMVICFTKKKI